MKKTILLSTLALLFANNIVFAGGVGYVDYVYLSKNIAIAKEYDAKLKAKTNQINNYNKGINTELKAKKTKQEKQQVLAQKKPGYDKLRKEFYDILNKKDDAVKAKIKAASDIVLTQKKLDVITDKRLVVSGGIDCTQDVLKAIK